MSRCECKIGRNIDRYDLEQLDTALRRRRRDEDASLRDLADFVNTQIVDAILADTDADIAGDPASIYAALADDEVPTDRRVRVNDQLAGVGIEVDRLEEHFVSYQSIRHHLRNCLDMDTSRSGVETVEEGREVIEWARDRARRVIERTLDRLERAGTLRAPDPTVSVSITVECGRCGRSFRIDHFLDSGGCSCQDGPQEG